MSMHPHSDALLRELDRTHEAARQQALQHRLLRTNIANPAPQNPSQSPVFAALRRLADHLRHRPHMPQTRRPARPTNP
jgi:hypothetical protein